ncbi:glycosyltransferase [Nocardia terpenica]|uniref:glycosyltransferase n=1 Tax=Nocardia terpenica TaxID=455432 RepID=UPI0039E0944F
MAPGPHETFGLAALEALAAGTPVVASRSSAALEYVRRSGRVIRRDSVAAYNHRGMACVIA